MYKVKRKTKSDSSPSGITKKRKEKALIIDVLGTEYTLRVPVDTSEMDTTNSDGLCDDIGKDIQIRDLRFREGYSKKNAIEEMKHNIRHELIHAFIKECGLAQNDSAEVSWAVNEACVDFYALQFDKLNELFKVGYLILKELD